MNRQRVLSKFDQYASSRWWGDRFDVRFHLISTLSKVRGGRILDVGCGIGIVLGETARKDRAGTGIDLSKEVLTIARRIYPGLVLVLGDAHMLPFRTEAFDILVIANALSTYDLHAHPKLIWLHKPEVQMREAYRVLKKGGLMFLTAWNGGHRFYRHSHGVTYSKLCMLLEPYFTFSIRGFNPLPFRVPERLIDRCGIGNLYMRFLRCLAWLPCLKKVSKFFFVKAEKKG